MCENATKTTPSPSYTCYLCYSLILVIYTLLLLQGTKEGHSYSGSRLCHFEKGAASNRSPTCEAAADLECTYVGNLGYITSCNYTVLYRRRILSRLNERPLSHIILYTVTLNHCFRLPSHRRGDATSPITRSIFSGVSYPRRATQTY